MRNLVVCVFLGLLLCALYQCLECPFGCQCFSATNTVTCVSKDLLKVPLGFPIYARTVIITGNNIRRIGPVSFSDVKNVTNIILSNNRVREVASHTFTALSNLRTLDLSGNQLVSIHPEAFNILGSPLQVLNLSRSLHNSTSLMDLTTALRWGGLGGLLHLDLSGNRLVLLPPGTFTHLPSLQTLLLPNNSLVSVYNGTFSGMNHLEVLDLSHNTFRRLKAEALEELGSLGKTRILLGHNPYDCSCEIHDFVAWMNSSWAKVADAGSVRCAFPKALYDTLLRGLGLQAVGCNTHPLPDVTDLSLQTSYVFLGLVLGFVGVVFLFVLYLNRKGMKKWMTDMRDACRDVLEGYHYRYEIDSDPRPRHVSAETGVGGQQRGHMGSAPSTQLHPETCVVKMPIDTQLRQVTTSPLNL